MADNIHYNFGANAGSLGDITGLIGNIQEVQSDINGIFATLATVYEGDGATALSQKHQQIDSKFEEAIHTAGQLQKQAQDQQDAMQHLDSQNAAAF